MVGDYSKLTLKPHMVPSRQYPCRIPLQKMLRKSAGNARSITTFISYLCHYRNNMAVAHRREALPARGQLL